MKNALSVVLTLKLFALAFHLQLFLAAYGTAMDFVVETAAGYDSNPALTERSESSGFSVYGLGMGCQFTLTDDLILEGLLEGRWQDYWEVGDNYLLQAKAALSYPLAKARVLSSLMGEVIAYRDNLVEEDERDEVMVGVQADWLISGRLTLVFEHAWRWLDFSNWSKPLSGRGQAGQLNGGMNPSGSVMGSQPGAIGSPSQGQGMNGPGGYGPMLGQILPPRDDLLIYTSLGLDIFLSPSISGSMYMAYGDLDSSITMPESYREIQAGISLVWVPAGKWRLEVETEWHRTEYHKVPETIIQIRPTNYTQSAGAKLSRFRGALELFGQVGFKKGDVPLDYNSYTQTVLQCGLSWSF